jgi:hypothetical protein
MIIENFFIQIFDREIFCTLLKSDKKSSSCLIYLSPLFEERMWAHRIAFNFAKYVSSNFNMSVLMFDYYGHGESDGFSEEFSINQCIVDIDKIIIYLKDKGYHEFSIWGIRTGSAIVNCLIKLKHEFSTIIHWAPTFNLYDYLLNGLRVSVISQYVLFKKTIAKREEILDDLLKYDKCQKNGYTLNTIESYRFGKQLYQEALILKDKLNSFEGYNVPTIILTLLDKEANNLSTTKNISFSDHHLNKITHKTVSDREFWHIGKTYSQRATKFYELTIDWLRTNNLLYI